MIEPQLSKHSTVADAPARGHSDFEIPARAEHVGIRRGGSATQRTERKLDPTGTPTPENVALQVNVNDPAWTPGTYQTPLAVSNSDGSAPTITTSAATNATAAIAPNSGSNLSWNGNEYPWILTITGGVPTVPGTPAVVEVLADGVVNLAYNVTVTPLPDETITDAPTLAVTTAPQPPAAAAGAT